MSESWYTIEYDENSVAWLVDEKNTRLCLEHGMRLYIVGRLATTLPQYALPQTEPTAGREEDEG